MRSQLSTYLRRNGIIVFFLVVLACDTFHEDSINPDNLVTFSQTEYYILPGTSAIIDLRSVIRQSFTAGSVSVSKQPTLGSLTELDPFLLKYMPHHQFTQGKDEFVISVLFDDGSTLKTQTLTIFVRESREEFPCGLFAIEDYVHVNRTTPSKISLLKNDKLCGEHGNPELSVHLNPKFGEAQVIGDSIIMYTPGSSFTGKDELVYRLADDGENISYGLVHFTEKKTQSLPIPHAMVDIFFVNDTVGFITGGPDIFKTINGGKSWNLLSYPRGQIENIDIQDLFFLDENTGFAAYSCAFEQCMGWMKTTNGGQSWERSAFDFPPTSIFFVSPSTGFITTQEILSWLDVSQRIFKTTDAGKTWKQVFQSKSRSGAIQFIFANDKLGYAYRPEDIFVTSDGGETWLLSASHPNVASVAWVSENIVTASVTNASPSVTAPSTMLRFDGLGWVPVTSFPYMIMRQDFSPNGDLGVAIGISADNPTSGPETQTMTLSKSIDEGETWEPLDEEIAGFPWVVSVPSANVAYILCSDKLIKYSP